MRQIFYLNTEPLFERACQLRDFGNCGELTWRQWYEAEKLRTGHSAGELEQAVAEALNIPIPARYGFSVYSADKQAVVLQDLEESGACDLTDRSDAHLILPVEQFREWLYKWNADPLNRVMDTAEAAAIWGYDQADSIKRMCSEGKLKARKLTKGWIIDRNQPNPRVTPQRKWFFTHDDVKGSLTLADDGYYEFEWGGLETQFKKTPAERDEFLKDNERIGRLIDQLAHAEVTMD